MGEREGGGGVGGEGGGEGGVRGEWGEGGGGARTGMKGGWGGGEGFRWVGCGDRRAEWGGGTMPIVPDLFHAIVITYLVYE